MLYHNNKCGNSATNNNYCSNLSTSLVLFTCETHSKILNYNYTSMIQIYMQRSQKLTKLTQPKKHKYNHIRMKTG